MIVREKVKDEGEKKAKVQKVAKELSDLMDVKPEEWANDVRATRHEM